MKRLAALLLLLSSPAYAKTQAIVGVALDRASSASTPASQKLAIPAGETGEIDISVTHSDGTVYDLTGAEMTLSVGLAGKYISRPATFVSVATGTAKFPLVIADTLSMLGTYTYDVTLTAADGSFYRVVPASAFVVTAGIGQPGQAVTVPATQQPLALGPVGPQGPSGTAGIIQSPPGTSLPNRTNTTFDGTLLKATDDLATNSTDITAPGLVAKTTTVSTTAPLGGGGALSGNLTLTCATCVTTARLISTGTGLSGGGDLSADRTFAIASTVPICTPTTTGDYCGWSGTAWTREPAPSGGGGTLQQSYTAGAAGPQIITLDSTRLGIEIHDKAGAGGIAGRLFSVYDQSGTVLLIGANSATGTSTIGDTSGSSSVNAQSSQANMTYGGYSLSLGGSGASTNAPFTLSNILVNAGYASGSRPSAVTSGAGAQIYDTTLSLPLWSNGTNWKDAAGTVR